METELLSSPVLRGRRREQGWLSTPALMALWALAGVFLVWGLANVPLERVQEARVLEVGREMLGKGFEGWMIPHANGEVRLHKPPLAYWTSALGFELFGVRLWAGRLATAIAGWLTLGVTFWMVSWLFNRRAAFFAALALFASFLFGKFFQLAETDPLSCLFTTAATFFLWRAVQSEQRRREYLWYHAGAAMLGLALMAKGPPMAFPILFFVCYVAVQRKWRCLWRFIISGAPITFAVLGLPWWIYVYLHRGAERWMIEMEVAADGQGHGAWFYIYIPYIFYGIVPWCAFVVAGVVESCRRCRADWRHRGMLLWIATILIPLCIVGNKQFHYLIPLMVPLMVLTGWLINELWDRRDDPGFLRAMKGILLGTILVCLLLPIAIVLIPKDDLGVIRPFDWAMAGFVLLMGLVGLAAFLLCDLKRAMILFALGVCLCTVLLRNEWIPSVDDSGWTVMKRFFHEEVADHPAVYYGRRRTGNLRYSFALRRVIPITHTPDELYAYLLDHPQTLVILPELRHDRALPPPPFLVEKAIARTHNETVGVFRFEQADGPSP